MECEGGRVCVRGGGGASLECVSAVESGSRCRGGCVGVSHVCIQEGVCRAGPVAP